MASVAQSRAIYRHLLRAVPHAVSYNKAATKNIRRMLADDVRAELRAPEPKLVERAQNTLLLFLASSAARNDETRTPMLTRIHRMMSNLSTLSYQHLAPHTAMQPNIRTRLIGGTDARTSRRLRSRRADAKYGQSTDTNDLLDSKSPRPSTINADFALPSLQVTGKRPRGPVLTAVEARVYTLPRWNGQNAAKFLARTQEAELLAEVERLAKIPEERMGSATQFKMVRGRLRTVRRQGAAEKEAKRLRLQAESMLSGVIARASEPGIFMGAARFARLARGEWLPP